MTTDARMTATVAKMYAEDGLFSGPGWTASGRAAIEEGFKKDIGAGVLLWIKECRP
jgi:hypothetical protein